MKKSSLFIIFFALFFLAIPNSYALGLEIFGQGSYMRYNTSSTHYSTTRTFSGGIDFIFWRLTAIELSYSNSQQKEIIPESLQYPEIQVVSTSQVASASILQNILPRTYAVQPYIKVGTGYLVKETKAWIGDVESNTITKESMTANGGVGVKVYVTRRIALEFSANLYVTGLRKDEETLYHYTYAGGLRVIIF